MATAGRAPANTAMSPRQGHRATLERIAAVERRMRAQRMLDTLPGGALVTVMVAAAGVCALKIGEGATAGTLLWCAFAPLPIALLASGLRATSSLRAARALDRALGESDLIASAWAFGSLEPSERSRFMEACIDSAARRVGAATAADALPLRRPRGLSNVLPALLGLGLLGLLEVPVRVAPPPSQVSRPSLLQQEDLAAFADEVTPVATNVVLDPELRELAAEINALLEAMGNGELEREEALRELRRLEAQLAEGLDEAQQDALHEALAELGRALGKQGATEALAEALQAGNAQRAQEELSQLAKELETRTGNAKQNSLLKKQLERAARTPETRDLEEERAKRQLERLLEKKRERGELSESDERLLKKRRRELERLQRQSRARSEARRRLDELRRHLGGAAGQLGQGSRQDAARELSEGADSLSRQAQSQMSREQRERLEQQVQQLRQLMSKQGQQSQRGQQKAGGGKEGTQGKQGRPLGLEGFGRAARGAQGPQGDKGPGKEGQALQLMKPGDGQQPSGVLEMRGMAGGEPRANPDATDGLEGGEGGRPGSSRASALRGAKRETQLVGEKGRGPTRSEVIREAGSRGFASRAYEDVHSEYERHAESVLERDEVPGGYRFYVRRYFQLIRPREGAK